MSLQLPTQEVVINFSISILPHIFLCLHTVWNMADISKQDGNVLSKRRAKWETCLCHGQKKASNSICVPVTSAGREWMKSALWFYCAMRNNFLQFGHNNHVILYSYNQSSVLPVLNGYTDLNLKQHRTHSAHTHIYELYVFTVYTDPDFFPL